MPRAGKSERPGPSNQQERLLRRACVPLSSADKVTKFSKRGWLTARTFSQEKGSSFFPLPGAHSRLPFLRHNRAQSCLRHLLVRGHRRAFFFFFFLSPPANRECTSAAAAATRWKLLWPPRSGTQSPAVSSFFFLYPICLKS